MEQNYLPLFRKYRPQSFKDVVGQESLVKALSNAIELNRIANAYLFCGPRGTGKTSCARIFAKSLNCASGPTLTPCQKCPSCVDITNASGLDVIEIDAASNRGIQDAKDLISRVRYAPINGKYKIFIIDEVHMLSNDAFNALLKTFEEPPENVIFILATTEPHKVLETIVSRCQRFDLRRITTDDIVKRLREISDLENIKITDEALYTIAKNVSGGLRDSLALLDQVSILGVKDEIGKDLIEELLGKINFNVLLNLLDNIYQKNIQKSINCIDEIYTKGSEPRNLAENFIEFLRNVILALDSDDIESIKNISFLIEDDIKKIKDSGFDKEKIIKILNIIVEYYKEIKISTNPYLWMELASIAACRTELSKNMEIKKQITKQQAKENTIEPICINKTQMNNNQAQQIKQEQQIQITDTPKNDTKDSSEIWTDIISNIKSLPAKAFYSGVAKLIGIEDKKIILGFLHENAIVQAKSDSKLPQLENAINSSYQGYSIEFIKIDSSTKTIEVKPKTSAPPVLSHPSQNQTQPQFQHEEKSYSTQDLPDESENKEKEKHNYSPKVQEMIEQFSGRIVE